MTVLNGSCEVVDLRVGACQIIKRYIGACLVWDVSELVAEFWGITPDPSTYVMLDVREGTSPITDARTSDLELADYLGTYHTFGQELGYSDGRVTGDIGSRVVYADDGVDPLEEVPWLVHAPQATNDCTNSRALDTDGVQSIVVKNGSLGFKGGANGWHFAATVATTSHEIYGYARITNGEDLVFSVFVRAKEQQWIQLAMRGSQTSPLNPHANFDVLNGVVGFNNYGAGEAGIEPAGNGFYRCWVKARVILTHSNSHILRICLTDDQDVTTRLPSYLGDGVSGIELDMVQIEEDVLTPPVPTSGSAVTRDACDLDVPLINHSDQGDKYTLDVVVAGPCNVFGTFLQYDGANFVLTDGTNSQSVAAAVGEHSIEILYSSADGEMSLSVDGSAHTPVAYNGILLRSDYKLFLDSPYVGKARNVRRYG